MQVRRCGGMQPSDELHRTSTSPTIISLPYLNDKHPSWSDSKPELEMMRGFASTSSSPFPLSPAGLKTIRRKLRPTCGAARPTPSSLHHRTDCSAWHATQCACLGCACLESMEPTHDVVPKVAVGFRNTHRDAYLYMTSKSSSANCCNLSPNTLIVAFSALRRGSGYLTMSFNVSGLFHSKESAAKPSGVVRELAMVLVCGCDADILSSTVSESRTTGQ